MNAGTVKCKCGVHYTARDPHPLCRNCSTRVCSRSHPCSICMPLSSAEWDLWLDQEVKTSVYGSTRISEESSSPATEGLGSPQDANVLFRSDSLESSGNSKLAVSSGEDILLASHFEVCLLCKPVSLIYLLTSCLGPSLGTETPQTSLPLSTPSLGGLPVSGVVHTRSSLPVTPVSVGSLSQSSSQPDFRSLPSFQTNYEDRSFGEQRVYPTEVEVLFEDSQVENRSLVVSMEEDLGSEEHVLISTNPLPPPPFRGWNRDPRSFSSGEPGFGGYQALGPRAPPPPPPRFLPGFIAKTQKPERPDTALSPVIIPALAQY